MLTISNSTYTYVCRSIKEVPTTSITNTTNKLPMKNSTEGIMLFSSSKSHFVAKKETIEDTKNQTKKPDLLAHR